MDIILYFLENPPDITSVAVLLLIYLGFEVLSEIIAEYVARPVFDKFRPDQRIKKVQIFVSDMPGLSPPVFTGENLHVRIKNDYLTVLDGRNPLYSSAPGQWTRWERLE